MKSEVRKTLKLVDYFKAKATGHYRWMDFPQVIQIDTNNFCGKRFCGVNCSYCYPQWKISLGERRHTFMPTDVIELILQQIHQYGRWKVDLIDLFLNGDALTEPRLPELAEMARKYVDGAVVQSFTCGTLTKNWENLLSLDSICFTISAHNRELYKTVHGGDKFSEALNTLRLVLEHRHRQQVEVHCVITKDNYPYVEEWWRFFGENFPEAKRILSPLVASYDNLPSKNALGSLTLDDLEKKVIEVAGAEGRMWTRELIPDGKPCVLWDNMSIDVEGWILQCCNWSPPWDVNYGNVYNMGDGYTLKDAWQRRLSNRMQNRLCESCNMKHPDWRTRLG